jgi:hypothetical protein
MNLCVDCQHCHNKKHSAANTDCLRPGHITGLPVWSKCLDERKPKTSFFDFFRTKQDFCGKEGKYFAKRIVPNVDFVKMRSAFLFHNIDAHAYHSEIGFQNALGTFEINEDKYELCKQEIKEFEEAVAYLKKSAFDYVVVEMNPDAFSVQLYTLDSIYQSNADL